MIKVAFFSKRVVPPPFCLMSTHLPDLLGLSETTSPVPILLRFLPSLDPLLLNDNYHHHHRYSHLITATSFLHLILPPAPISRLLYSSSRIVVAGLWCSDAILLLNLLNALYWLSVSSIEPHL
ncbi:hypothetical protein TSMEX_003079 [Taenia solium]|eukprot:TsM_000266700 transcript=TsM_000266700 gene=TsM_000266700